MEKENPKVIKSERDYSSVFLKNIRKEALITALDTRKFEIELYWKRATYFWAFIATTFAGYFLLLNAEKINEYKGFTIVISAIGYFFSLGWYFVNRGSRVWQKNWEKHVSFLEREIQGPLFAYVRDPDNRFLNLKGEYPFSVSKVNQLLSLMMVFFWFGTFVFSNFFSFNKLWFINDSIQGNTSIYLIIALIVVLGLLSIGFKKWSYSFLKKNSNDSSNKEKKTDFFMTKAKYNLTDPSTITMGNDEFILYIRKTSESCTLTNDKLGKMIWEWLRDQGAIKTVEDMPCLWGKSANNIDALLLPQTATQFEFDRTILPDLYNFLDELKAK